MIPFVGNFQKRQIYRHRMETVSGQDGSLWDDGNALNSEMAVT
jgi:hypothetical protein